MGAGWIGIEVRGQQLDPVGAGRIVRTARERSPSLPVATAALVALAGLVGFYTGSALSMGSPIGLTAIGDPQTEARPAAITMPSRGGDCPWCLGCWSVARARRAVPASPRGTRRSRQQTVSHSPL